MSMDDPEMITNRVMNSFRRDRVMPIEDTGIDGTSFKNKREAILRSAEKIINGDRNVQYGDPNADFRRTAELWSTYLQGKHAVILEAHDVAIMMILLKVSRLAWSPDKADSWCDIAGYAGCGFDVSDAKVSDLP